jgi:hypothetical protein
MICTTNFQQSLIRSVHLLSSNWPYSWPIVMALGFSTAVRTCSTANSGFLRTHTLHRLLTAAHSGLRAIKTLGLTAKCTHLLAASSTSSYPLISSFAGCLQGCERPGQHFVAASLAGHCGPNQHETMADECCLIQLDDLQSPPCDGTHHGHMEGA